MSLLGVAKINDMTDCTKVLPAPITSFPGVGGGNGTSPPPPPYSSSVVYPTSSYGYPTSTPSITYTSTYCETTSYTVTKCPPTVAHCPADYGYETTETLTYTTTWCPDTEGPEGTPKPQAMFYPNYSAVSSPPAEAVYGASPTETVYDTSPTGKAQAAAPSQTVVTAGAGSVRSWLALVVTAVGLAIVA